MSPKRRERILSVMAMKERQKAAGLARDLQDEEAQVLRNFDLNDRLGQMIDQGRLTNGACTLGQLTGALWLGPRLQAERNNAQGRIDEAQTRANELRTSLTQCKHREQVVSDRADEARALGQAERSARAEAAAGNYSIRRR